MDPDTYKKAMLDKFSDSSIIITDETDTNTSSSSTSTTPQSKKWEYIRVDALGFLPGLICPHHDKIQSNGIPRSNDFNRILLQSPNELGIAIDHWAALVIDGDEYYVMSLENKPGSVKNGSDFVNDGSGLPGVWIKEVVVVSDDDDGSSDGGGGEKRIVRERICPSKGKVKDLLRVADNIQNDEDKIRQCRMENPQPKENN